ncbi:hypothetical protein [Brazilian marseillevirus]|uniref:hypothetical protein n=1 Tax=Brazilian marseillevirus TaxID=1813599 RepID=UPI0007866F38|nr:hypothetical protein A3303_gp478 [Brazilian marseillevirus]AMQ10986.1 hypothetical protein [Brazilian marseillevirus]
MKVLMLKFRLWLHEFLFEFKLFDEKVLSDLRKEQREIIRKAGLLRLLSSYAPEKDGDGSEHWLSSYQSVEKPRKLSDLCIRKLFSLKSLENIWLLWLSSKSGEKREITDFPTGCRKPSLQTTKVLLSSVPGFLFTDNVCLCINHDTHCKLMTLRTIKTLQYVFTGKKKDIYELQVLQDTSDFENSCFALQDTEATEEECYEMVQGKGQVIFENSWCIVNAFESNKKVKVYGFPKEENTWIYYFDL